MKQPYVVAIISKDAVEHLPVVVPAHEVAVLAAVHDGRVSIDESADLPAGLTEAEIELDDEFARLEQRYGVHPDSKISHVSMAYGGFDGFMRALESQEPRRRAKKTA